MIYSRKLLGAEFSYNTSTKELNVVNLKDVRNNNVTLNRTYMFSLMRFLVSMSQKTGRNKRGGDPHK